MIHILVYLTPMFMYNAINKLLYPVVVIPVPMNRFVMLQRNLIYTGISRTKKNLILVDTKKTLDYAIRNMNDKMEYPAQRAVVRYDCTGNLAG